MKKTGLFFLALCICAFSLFSCGKQANSGSLSTTSSSDFQENEEDTTSGIFIEKDITPENMQGGIRNFYADENGYIALLTTLYAEQQSDALYISHDYGESWAEESLEWLYDYVPRCTHELNQRCEGLHLNNRYPLEEGAVLAEIYDYSTDSQLFLLKEQGKDPVFLYAFADIDFFPQLSNFSLTFTMFYYSGNGKAVFQATPMFFKSQDSPDSFDFNEEREYPVFVFDIYNDKIINSYNETKMLHEQCFGDDEYFYYPSSNIGSFNCLSMNEQQSPQETAILNISMLDKVYGDDGSRLVQKNSAGSYISVGKKGIAQVDANGEYSLIMPAQGYSLASPLCSITSFMQAADDRYIVEINKVGTPAIKSYVFNPNAMPQEKTQLEVFCLYDSLTLNLAKLEFEAANPDVQINVNPVYTGKTQISPQQMDDILKQLVTELLAGKGPDIIILDGLPYKSFAQHGMFEDLSMLAKESGIFEELTAPLLATDGSLPYAPMAFTVPVMLSDMPIPSFEDVSSLAQAVTEYPDYSAYKDNITHSHIAQEDMPLIFFDNLNDLSSLALKLAAPGLLDGKQEINGEVLRVIIEDVNKISSHYGLAQPLQKEFTYDRIGTNTGELRISYNNTASNGLSQYKSRAFCGETDSLRIMGAIFSNRYTYASLFAENEEIREEYKNRNSIYMQALPAVTGAVFTPVHLSAVNVNSQNKEQALNFIRFMLSKNVQNYDLHEGLPATKGGYSAVEQKEIQSSRIFMTADDNLYFDMPQILADISFAYETVPQYEMLFTQNVEDYCGGLIDLETSAANIEAGMRLYFAEK